MAFSQDSVIGNPIFHQPTPQFIPAAFPPAYDERRYSITEVCHMLNAYNAANGENIIHAAREVISSLLRENSGLRMGLQVALAENTTLRQHSDRVMMDNHFWKNAANSDAVQELEGQVQDLQAQLKAAKGEVAACEEFKKEIEAAGRPVQVCFCAQFKCKRLQSAYVYVNLVSNQTLENTMWDFADRTGKFFDCLRFSKAGSKMALYRTDTVAAAGLRDGDFIDVEWFGTEETRLQQAEPE